MDLQPLLSCPRGTSASGFPVPVYFSGRPPDFWPMTFDLFPAGCCERVLVGRCRTLLLVSGVLVFHRRSVVHGVSHSETTFRKQRRGLKMEPSLLSCLLSSARGCGCVCVCVCVCVCALIPGEERLCSSLTVCNLPVWQRSHLIASIIGLGKGHC